MFCYLILYIIKQIPKIYLLFLDLELPLLLTIESNYLLILFVVYDSVGARCVVSDGQMGSE